MGGVISVELALVLAAAPSILGWIMGEMYGARRMRKLLEERERPATDLSPVQYRAPLAQQADIVQGGSGARTGEVGVVRATDVVESKDCQPAGASLLEPLPCPMELHAQAAAIRADQRIWDDPDTFAEIRATDPVASRVLNHYGSSIHALRAADPFPKHDLPRFSDAAPIDPRTHGAGLVIQRQAQIRS